MTNGTSPMKRTTLVLAALMILSGGETWAAKSINKTFPDRVQHARAFLKLRPGVSLKLFRTSVSAHWKPASRMYSHRHGLNPKGEFNSGYYSYYLEARGTFYPQANFHFWGKKIVRMELTWIAQDFEESEELITDADRLFPVITRIYGKPSSVIRTQNERSYTWRANRFDILVRALLPDLDNPRSIGQMSIRMQNKSGFEALNKFSRRYPEKELASGPVGYLFCSRKVPSGANRWFEIGFYFDTRKLDEKLVNELTKTRGQILTKAGYKCEPGISKEKSAEDNIVRIIQRQPSMKTYLRYVDSDGVTSAITFPNTSIGLEDSVCEQFLPEIRKTAREAECITGTAIWQRVPN